MLELLGIRYLIDRYETKKSMSLKIHDLKILFRCNNIEHSPFFFDVESQNILANIGTTHQTYHLNLGSNFQS